MNSFEIFLLGTGLSWTTSKIFPYFLFILLGILLYFSMRKRLKNRKMRLLIGFPMITAPFLFYFSLFPIYEGDFSNTPNVVKQPVTHELLKGNKLLVLAIPNCPFCFESISKLKLIKKRNPGLEINFSVCTSNEEGTLNYIKESEGKFTVSLVSNPDQLVGLAQEKFPSFFMIKDNKIVKVWSNASFGVLAIDELEQTLGS